MKFLAVCGFGVGSSMVLKLTLDSVINDLNIDVEVENTDLTSAKSMEADAYFTSVDIAKELISAGKSPVYPIKKYMDKDEILANVKEFLAMKG